MFKPVFEYVEGNACAICWGNGKTFGDVPTPERIEMTGSGFAGVFAVCNDTFIADQTALNACRYEFHIGTVNGTLIFSAIDTYFELSVDGEGLAYAELEGICVKVSTNAGKTVSVAVAEPPTPEYKFAINQNFSPSLLTHFLALGPTDSDEVSVIARRRDQVKLHFRFSPEY